MYGFPEFLANMNSTKVSGYRMEPCEINMIIMVRKFVDTLYVRTIAIDYYLQGSDSIYKMISITSWLNTNQ